jgi:PAS domain-containing protein
MQPQPQAQPQPQPQPLVLASSWPLWERPRHFDLGHVLNSVVTDILEPAAVGALAPHHAGCWECDLKDNALVWSGGVYDIFGIPRGSKVSREEAVALYCEDSRAKMERLRSYALKHRRGFTLDVEIRAAIGEHRWMRLIGVPICIGGEVVRLQGLKLAI